MLTLRVDSSLIPGVNAPITVDALLSAVEPVLAEARRIVTAVRINGVDEPAFREADILMRDLQADDAVDVDTTPVGVMAALALDDALRFLPDLTTAARAVAAGLRGTDVAGARAAIGDLADNLALLVALVHTADTWAGQAGLASTGWLGSDVQAVERAAAAIEDTAGNEDWMSAADALEYDLAGALEGWKTRLEAGRAALQGAAPATTA